MSLQESIRYAPGDAVEKWLNDLLCLDCLNITRIVSGCPLPEACDLYPPGLRAPRAGAGEGRQGYGKGLALGVSGEGRAEHSRFPLFPPLVCFCWVRGVPVPKVRGTPLSRPPVGVVCPVWAFIDLFLWLNSEPSYYVNRDTLFCYHKASEVFLQRLMALYVASHYKVTATSPRGHSSPDRLLLLGFCIFCYAVEWVR